MKAIEEAKGILVVTADHGNADEMFEVGKDGKLKKDKDGNLKPKTSHTLNPVPCYIFDPSNQANFTLNEASDLGISSLAATCINLLGYEAPDDYDASIVKI